jgi:hypothetical protein
MKGFALWVLLGISFSGSAQSIFKVVLTIKNSGIMDVDGAADTATYYRIHLSGDTSEANLPYPFDFGAQPIDTIRAIAELLSFENDDRRCALPITDYDRGRQPYYTDRDTHYSIQVEALYLINQLVYPSPFTYAPYPVLFDDLNKRELATSGLVISQAFYAYGKWFKKLKKIGIAEIREKKIMPLDGAYVRWY